MAELASVFSNALVSDAQVSSPQNIEVYFAPAGQTWTESGTTYTSDGWTPDEIAQAMAALQTWANVANLNFTITTSRSSADFYLTTQDISGGTIGYFYLPGNYALAGYGSFDNQYGGWTPEGIAQGGHGFALMLHEFGHGLGLLHSHADHFFEPSFPGVSHSADRGDNDLNQSIYTVMSYIDGWVTAPGIGATSSYSFGHAATPMAFDIAAIQSIYGANTNHAQGNTVYALPDANQAGTFYSAIWDTGGTDTIVNNSAIGAVIDLRPATLQNEAGGGGWVSHVTGIHGGFTIAADVVIENATGGSGGDTIMGNTVDNVLTGNGGDDTILDTFGNDTLDGGDGNDTLTVDLGINTLVGGDGSDLLKGGTQSDLLNGGGGHDALQGDPATLIWGGSDRLQGGTGNDTLMGGIGADAFIFEPGDGNDIIGEFDANSYNSAAAQVVVVTGSDFQTGVDRIELHGFGTAVFADVMNFVTLTQSGQQFSAEGTQITFFGVTTLSADDFVFV